MLNILAILLTAILFLVLILLLAAKPNVSRKITTAALAIAGISGLLIYGYGYSVVIDNFALAVLKALLAVAGSFVGKNEYSNISSVPIMQTQFMEILCTFIQVCALYATASAVITSLGAEALKKLRLWLARRNKLNLIYGTHTAALDFGKQLLAEKRGVVVFVAENPGAAAVTAISAAGCVLRADTHALAADRKFLKSIGAGRKNREITLYALDKNSTANIRYAEKLLASLKESGANPEQLRLVILGQEEVAVSSLQVTPKQYGYGFVTAVDEPRLAARLLMLKYPPRDTVTFDKNAKAQEDFEALVIGFGQMGKAVLKALVMNSQFEGSHFRATVFAPDCTSADGSFASQFPTLYRQYDITFRDQDARSRQMYEYLRERAARLKYVAVCTGNEKLNHEIAEDLTDYFRTTGYAVPVYKCSRSGVEAYASDGTVAASHKLYSCELLCGNELDAMAMILNYRYQPASDKTALENWMNCDYFSRQSCRASADFVPAMLRAAGKTRAQVANGDWNLTDVQLENLSKHEHLRWCAFHYCMGFAPMSAEEFDARAVLYRQQLEEGKTPIRIGKNMAGRTHACLTDWENLTALSEKEAAITGKYVDYKDMDTENVLAIRQLLQPAEN